MTTEQVMNVAGFVVETDGDAFGLPCLGGADVNRYPDRLWVYARDGRLLDLGSESPLIALADTMLQGWDELDGPSYLVGPVSEMWRCNVPVTLLDALAARLGVTLPKEVR